MSDRRRVDPSQRPYHPSRPSKLQEEIPFDFTEKALFGWRKKKGSGSVRKVLLAPSGRHTIGIELIDAERGSIGSRSFERSLPAGSDWSLRVDLPDRAGSPHFFLVQSSR